MSLDADMKLLSHHHLTIALPLSACVHRDCVIEEFKGTSVSSVQTMARNV